ncbi:Glucosyl transferase GtrII [Pseudobutyrivibrio sp. ACV-2]|uniref:glucosyltransferase domain-containing protein n=1 Tax=Pseudobutyrivibrio sp. ACV-2 TaxID=1520801 RepID=UPI00089D32CB|nr:glucosyltransferase domain-containing protein [Pseudobutyrivibrio sp. ACV-2]SEB00864.1 Glucosyl transferase GtrII [Pseudobutyrivibrio sp. ACV-2]
MNYSSKIEKLFECVQEHFSEQQRITFIATMVLGLIAHGYALFNRISYHDNAACLFSLGGTYESGRWALGFIYDFQMKTTKLFAVPVFNGLLSMIFIALSAMLIIELFNVRNKVWASYIGMIMVAYPVVTSIFSFMFTAWEYFLALFLSVYTVYILRKKLSIGYFVASAAILSISLGLYQAFFAVTIGLFLLTMFMDVINGKITSIKEYILHGVIALCQLIVGLGIWAIMRKITLNLKGIEAVEYKGMSDGYTVALFPKRLVIAYQEFFSFSQEGINATLYQRVFTAIIVIVVIMQIVYAVINANQNTLTKCLSMVGLALLPLAMNVVYILSTSDEYQVDTLMLYGNIFIFILPLLMIEWLEQIGDSYGFTTKLISMSTWLQILSLVILLVGYTYMDNAAYMKGEIAVEQATAYFTELVANIKATDGFDDDMEIVFVGWDKLEDATNAKIDADDQLEAIKLEKFPRFTDIIAYGGARYFMQEHLGFGNDNLIEDDGTVASEYFVKDMPTYPKDGAIAIVDDRVIVKLGE